MENKDILNYVQYTPGNTNRRILNQMLNQLKNGAGGLTISGVKFLDYDGEIVTAWASDEVASKTALPDNPTHNGLVAQGWNWDLQHIKDYIAVYENANVYVGQMYETTSGLTEMDVTLTKVTGLTVTCNMVGNKNWGDGTEDALTEHTYSEYGDYTITCDGTSIPSGTDSSGGLFDSSEETMNQFWCTAIRIGGNVVSIEEYALSYCSSLTNITIPNNVMSIGDYAFFDCSSLINITIPDSVTSISESVFDGCSSLTSLIIPDNVMSIGDYAFFDCSSLINITIPDSVTSIDPSVFAGCQSLMNIIIPDSVTNIGDYAFEGCFSLMNIAIPDNITIIGASTFGSCSSLKSITIPNNVTSIGENAFDGCGSLTNIIIPDSVTSIGDYAFAGCFSIKSYDFSSVTSVPTLSGAGTFLEINGICKIIVPDSLYNDWITAENWSTYADYIYKASEVS